MKLSKAVTVIILILAALAAAGLYFAAQQKELPEQISFTGPEGKSLAELWQSRSSAAATGNSVSVNGADTAGTETTSAVRQVSAAKTNGTTTAKSTARPAASAAGTAGKTSASAAKPAGSGKYAFDYEGIHPAVAAFAPDEWYLLLVNRDFSLPADYKPATAVCVDVYQEKRELDARVAPHYREMYYAALRDGAELIPYSGYRRISTQKTNFENKISYWRGKGYSQAEAVHLAAQSILPPGCSEHEAGLSMDITRPGVWDVREDFEDSKEFAWLQKHAASYGFTLRYPKNKTEVTQIRYEPWHWRYVGVEAAQAMKKSGQCLEEYLKRR
jgi:D-alanyl-D-alanine carboxypeptidase